MLNSVKRLGVFVAWCAGLVTLCSCSQQSETGPTNVAEPGAQAATAVAIPAGQLMDDVISFEFAVYYLPTPARDPLPVLDALLAGDFGAFRKVEKLDEAPTDMTLSARVITDVQEAYAPPDLDSLQYFGRGLSRQQAESLQGCTTALILDFGYPKQHVWDGLKQACELVSAVARQTDGLVWDEETREVFTPDNWDEKRLEAWTETIPDISDHATIHAYNTGQYVRAITLGMVKFGVPDIVVEDFSWSLNRTIGIVINLFGQAIAEKPVIETDGQFDLDLKAIRNAAVREPQVASLKPNATAVASLTLYEGTWEEGDPDNRIVEIGFDRYDGNDRHAKQEKMVSSLFGWEDSVTPVKHNEEILAASRRAKAKLPSLRTAFQAGLAPGEFIQVKAPFATPDGGQEWMWVEVTAWNGPKIQGLLKNEPLNIPDLHGGQIVEVSQDDVFDYIRRKPDGSQEGNETGELIGQSR